MQAKLNARNGFIAVVVYMIASIIAGVAAVIFFGGVDTTPDERLIDGLIDSSTAAYLLVAIGLLIVIAFVFTNSRRDVFFERERFNLSPLYYFYPMVLVGVTIWALTGVDFEAYSTQDILLILVATFAIGFNEEVVTRGFLLVGLRNRGVAEWQVWLVTSVVFALLHAVNLLGGSNITQIFVTGASGALFYASRRVFGTLFVPIILHALYDVGFFMLSGTSSPEGDLPSAVLDIHLGSFLIMLAATIVFVIFGRGLLKNETTGWNQASQAD